jgi:hypothetical protein
MSSENQVKTILILIQRFMGKDACVISNVCHGLARGQ